MCLYCHHVPSVWDRPRGCGHWRVLLCSCTCETDSVSVCITTSDHLTLQLLQVCQ